MNHKILVFVSAGALASMGAIAGVGCDGYTGLAGAPGPAGPPGPPGTGIADGGGGEGGTGTGTTVIVSARAKVGLDITPVPLNLTGLTADQVEQIGYGSYLVNAIGDCNGCHQSTDTPPKFLAGGTKFDLGGGNVVYSRNITQGGPQLTEAQFVEALQTGKDFGNSGQALLVMPWAYYRWMTTADLKAMYAYIQAVPAITNAAPSDNKAALFTGGSGIVPLPTTYNVGDSDPNAVPLPADGSPDPNNALRGLAIQPLVTPPGFGNNGTAPATPVSIEDQQYYGAGSYIVNSIGACNSCHTNPSLKSLNPTDPNYLKINTAGYLTGGQVFVVPSALQSSLHQVRNMSQNLLGTTHGYYDPYAAFLSIIDQGVHSLDPQLEPVGYPMPWQAFRNMVTDDQLAVYTYILNATRSTSDKATSFNAEWCASDNDCTWHTSDTDFAGEKCDTAAGECVIPCATDGDCSLVNCQTKCRTADPLKGFCAVDPACVANGI